MRCCLRYDYGGFIMGLVCSGCGAQTQEDALFCTKCGQRIIKTQQTAQSYQRQEYAPPQPFTPPQPQPYAQPQPRPQAYTQPQPQAYVQPQPQPQAYTQPQPQAYAQPQPQAYAQPQPQPYVQPQPQPYVQPQPQPQMYAPSQPQPPVQSVGGMMADMRTVLFNAPGALNRPDQPWEAVVEGNSIIARWKWMDARFFSAHEVNDETRQFTFIVTLSENGKWKELDRTEKKSSGVSMSGGKLGFGSSSSSFKGKTNQKSFQLGVGQNKQNGQAGIVSFKFDTTALKQPVRDYLTACGWKKAGMF